jgi:hypothetical protein
MRMQRMRLERYNEMLSVPLNRMCTVYFGDEGEALRHVSARLVRLCSRSVDAICLIWPIELTPRALATVG